MAEPSPAPKIVAEQASPAGEVGRQFLRALPALLLPGLLLGIIYSGIATPTEAAAIAACYALVLALLVYRTLSLARLYELLVETVVQSASIGLIFAGAYVFNYVVATEGLPHLLRDWLVAKHLSAWQFLLVVNLVLILLAVLIDEVTILLVVVPVLIPVAGALGIDLVHFGVVVMVNMMIGLVLPRHGLLLFVMTNLTKTSLAELFREIPFFIAVLFAMLMTYVPAAMVRDVRPIAFTLNQSGSRRDAEERSANESHCV